MVVASWRAGWHKKFQNYVRDTMQKMWKDKRSMKEITIATDVSCDAEYGIATWACCIEHNGQIIKKVGRFKKFTKNTALAETHALINALVIAKKEVKDWKDCKVTIYNEVYHVLEPLRTKAGNIKLRDESRAQTIKSIALPILQEAVDYEVKKVKAHYAYWYRVEDNKKYILNRLCDTEARAELKEYRKQIRKQNKMLALI